MKKLVVLALVLTATFCSSPVKKNMMVNGKIDGLRKGMLYLQKMEDTLLISVDSIEIKGDDNFTLGDDIGVVLKSKDQKTNSFGKNTNLLCASSIKRT